MRSDDIIAMIASGEGETLEFKRSTAELVDGMRNLCAMANHKGGALLFGILPDAALSSDRRAVGQHVADSTLATIGSELRKFEPPLPCDLQRVPTAEGREVIVLSVPGGSGPFVYDGRPYRKLGSTKERMPQEQYDRLLSERRHGASRWEVGLAKEVSLKDLDTSEVVVTVDEAIRRGRLAEPGTRDPERLLDGLGLLRDGLLLNAAVALFADQGGLISNYPQCLLRMARFRGHDKSEFLDNRQEHGNAFHLFRSAQRFMIEHLPIAGRIVAGVFERVDDPIYPPEALREALANAIIHRDYSIVGGSVSLAVYQDRLEITSAGPLPFGQTVEDLFLPHPSRPWNPLIARVFYLRGLVESWGRGTLRMAELSRGAGLQVPEFIATSQDVTVRFTPVGYVAPFDVRHNLTDLQRSILTVLARHPSSSLSSVLQGLPGAVSRRTVQNNLHLLRELGLVSVQGERRWAKWSLV